MLNIIKKTYLPLISTILLMTAIGLFNTIIYVEVDRLGYGKQMVGLATSLYYLGLLMGSLVMDYFIKKHGYLKTFVSFMVVLVITTAIYDLTTNIYIWMALRVVSGFSLAVSFVIIISWMMSVSGPHERGVSLAIYNISFFGAITFGQYLFGFTSNDSLIPFVYIAILIALSILPLCIAKVEIPQEKKPVSMSIIELFKVSQTAKISVLMAGILQASLYGFLPIYCLMKNFDNSQLSQIMAALVFGGTILQYPLGKLSDKFDRSKTVIGMYVALIVLSLLIMISPNSFPLLAFLLFIYGGLVFAIYPIALNILGDKLGKSAFTSINQGVLFSNSLGAIIGPLLAPWPIEHLGYNGLFIFIIIICLITLGSDYLIDKYRMSRNNLK